MSAIELTEEQRAAIYTPGSLLVRAGAGSGKTEVLARRFVALLAGDIEGREPLSPEQIVAITFTEKATYDMKQRIAKVLGERLERAAADDQPPLAAHLARARRLLPLARISTIHAFCARLLREHPLEAGVDPDFEVLDEYQSRTFLEAGLEEFLIAALRRGDPGARHLIEARGLRSASEYREGALGLMLKLIEEMERLGRTPQWLLEATGRACREIELQQPQLDQCARELAGKIEKLMAIKAKAPKAASMIAELKRRWTGWRPGLEHFNAHSSPADLQVLRVLAQAIPEARAEILKEPVKEINALLHTDDSRCGLSGTLIELYGSQRAVGPTREVCATVAEAAATIAARKRREAVATFNDLLVLAHRLLTESAAVAGRYRRMFRAVLADEYQDTDPIQDAVVRALTAEAGGGEHPELFMVGDEKQSIYRFRGADVTAFNRQRSPAPRPLPLRQNRRATPNLLAFVNGLSEVVMRAGQQPAAPCWVEWRADHRLEPYREGIDEPSVELILSTGSEQASTAEGRQLEAVSLAKRCRELASGSTLIADPQSEAIRPARWADMAILMRSFVNVEVYERALRDALVPYHTVKGRGFFRCAEILDVAALLEAVADPADTIALAAALRSPFFALSDQCLMEIAVRQDGQGRGLLEGFFALGAAGFDRLAAGREDALRAWRVLNELREMKERCGLAELIERALELTDFEAVMLAQSDGRQRAANIRKLLEIAREFQSRRFFGLADFIRHLQRLTELEPREPQAQILGEDENVVRLMTIHQAKGLEFPIVLVADLGRAVMHPDLDYLISAEHGLLMRATIGSGQDELPNARLDRHREQLKEQERAERARLLYVALTRARDRLILSEGANPDEWAAEVRQFAGKEKIEAFIASGKVQETITAGQAQLLLRRPATASGEPAASAPAELSAEPQRAQAERLAQMRLGFTPAPARELVISPTQLADFDRCPRQYYYRHVVRIPEGGFFHEDGAGGSGALELGLVAHAALERIDLGLTGKALADELERALDSCAAEITLDPQDRAALRRDLLRYLEARDRSERVAGRELPFCMRLEKGGLSLFVRGQIDVLLEDCDNWVVRDYKYARPCAQDAADYRVQMECYALAASSGFGARAARAELIFLREQPQTVEVALSEPHDARTRLLALGRAMLAAERAQEYPKKPPEVAECRRLGCGYIGRCWHR